MVAMDALQENLRTPQSDVDHSWHDLMRPSVLLAHLDLERCWKRWMEYGVHALGILPNFKVIT